MDKYKGYSKLLFMALLVIFMAGCGSGGGSNSSSSQTGTLSVSLTDAPAAGGFDAVNVTVSKVRVHQSASAGEDDAGWTDITLNPALKINLLSLTNGVLEDLGQTSLAAGHYTQLRLVLVANAGLNLANSVVLSGTTTEIALDTPSAVQSGIKLINEFDVFSGERVDLVLDFDALKSVVARGNGTYLLKPVVKVVPTQLNGIDGFVGTALLVSNVMVSAQVEGTVVRSTVPTQTGEFFLARLEPGTYDVVITGDDRATVVIAGVPVESDTITTVSTREGPITLPASATRTISGNVEKIPNSTEVAFVAAKQTFTAGPEVTIKYQGVDLSTGGAYMMTLPVDAPLLGQYSATLPIALATQLAVAGKYTV